MRIFVLACVLAWCGSAWAQGSYPDGSPFDPGTASQGIGSNPGSWAAPWTGQDTPQGDLRSGWGGYSNIGIYYGSSPISGGQYGGMGVRFYFEADYKGTSYGGGASNGVYNYEERSYWLSDPEWGNYWRVGGVGGGIGIAPSLALKQLGCPPGVYGAWVDAVSSRNDGVAAQVYLYGWYCPKLYKVLVTVVDQNGTPVANCKVTPAAWTAMWSPYGVFPDAWKPGVTDTAGRVLLVFPEGDGNCNTVKILGAPGQYGGGVAENPFHATGVAWKDPSPPGMAVKVVVYQSGARPQLNADTVPTPSPEPTPTPAPGGGGSGTSSPDFWSSLWVPDPAKLEQFQSHKDFWGSWGPFGLVGQVAGIWNNAALAVSDDHKYDGLIFPIVGPLGSSSIDLRPELGAGVPDYPTGGRGGPGGSVLGVIRGGAGLVVWCAALFGLYKKLRPVFVS